LDDRVKHISGGQARRVAENIILGWKGLQVQFLAYLTSSVTKKVL